MFFQPVQGNAVLIADCCLEASVSSIVAPRRTGVTPEDLGLLTPQTS